MTLVTKKQTSSSSIKWNQTAQKLSGKCLQTSQCVTSLFAD